MRHSRDRRGTLRRNDARGMVQVLRTGWFNGVLELVVSERTTILEIALEDDVPRQLLVDWERPDDHRVVEPADVALVPGRVRFERRIPGPAKRSERLVFERDVLRRFDLAAADPEKIVAIAGAEGLPEPLIRP